ALSAKTSLARHVQHIVFSSPDQLSRCTLGQELEPGVAYCSAAFRHVEAPPAASAGIGKPVVKQSLTAAIRTPAARHRFSSNIQQQTWTRRAAKQNRGRVIADFSETGVRQFNRFSSRTRHSSGREQYKANDRFYSSDILRTCDLGARLPRPGRAL